MLRDWPFLIHANLENIHTVNLKRDILGDQELKMQHIYP